MRREKRGKGGDFILAPRWCRVPLRMVCSLGALKLCEWHPVDGYTFCLASYYAIGTYSVLGAKPILGCISRFGRFTGTPRDYLRDIISDISSFWLLSTATS